MDTPTDAQLMAALEKDEAYHVERVLASGEAGSTEVVSRPGAEYLGEGPLVRKRVKRDVANVEVFSRLSSAAGKHLPHVVETYDLPDQVVIVREYVYGASLASCVAEAGRMGEIAAGHVVADVCDAVATLHERGIVHRDVSPRNAILSSRGAVLIDLGIARTYVEGAPRDTTRLGTWGFASPEQYGFAQTDGRSDVYSIGCLLGYMLTGVTPDAEGYAAALADSAVVRPELRRIVEKACSFEPSERYQSAGALRDAVLQAVPDADQRELPASLATMPESTRTSLVSWSNPRRCERRSWLQGRDRNCLRWPLKFSGCSWASSLCMRRSTPEVPWWATILLSLRCSSWESVLSLCFWQWRSSRRRSWPRVRMLP